MMDSHKTHVIVVGNEKGGSGKSTVAMHLIIGLLRAGLKVSSIDLDARQSTLSSYINHRTLYNEANGVQLPMPVHHVALHETGDEATDKETLTRLMEKMKAESDVVVLDTPGSAHYLSGAGHAYADTLITPLNDSFIDLAVLAKVDPLTLVIKGPSHYAELVWEMKKQRALKDGGQVRWIVMRNRLSHLDAKNKQEMERQLLALAKRIGFDIAPGLGERVIYREMFLKGLTLWDVRDGPSVQMNLSHVAARQELRHLLAAVGLTSTAP